MVHMLDNLYRPNSLKAGYVEDCYRGYQGGY